MNQDDIKITVGIPVFNGEKFIRKAIDSVLSQTFSNYTLIISDNGSTDNTSSICQEYEKKEKRIKYIRHEKNSGGTWNFGFLLEQASTKYFVWLGADDYWEPTFLEKNFNILESNNDVAFSISKIRPFGEKHEKFLTQEHDSFIKKQNKKIRLHFRPHSLQSTSSSSYENRVRSLLKNTVMYLLFYAFFRTDVLRNARNNAGDNRTMFGSQMPLIALRHGNLHVINEYLINRYTEGISGRQNNPINDFLDGNLTLSDLFLSKSPFIIWCWKYLGKKIFLRNLDYFIKLSFANTQFTLISFIRFLINRKNEYPKSNVGHEYE